MSKNIIEDGYTREGYIEAWEGVHDEMDFTYRPMLPNEVTRLERALEKSTDGSHGDIIAGVLAKKLETWSEVDKDGEAILIDFKTVRRLPWLILATTSNIVKGTRASDLRKSEVDTDASEDNDTIIDNILGTDPKPEGQKLLEAERKN